MGVLALALIYIISNKVASRYTLNKKFQITLHYVHEHRTANGTTTTTTDTADGTTTDSMSRHQRACHLDRSSEKPLSSNSKL